MKYSVMIVEDEPPSMRSIKRSIHEAASDFAVTAEAYSGEEALSLIEDCRPDVVFTDVRMPGMDGISLAHQLNERYPYICKIIVSGYQDFSYAQRALKTNVEDYLLKPLEPLTLRETLGQIRRKLAAIRGDDVGQLEYALSQKNFKLFINLAGILLRELVEQRKPHARIEAYVRHIVSLLKDKTPGFLSDGTGTGDGEIERILVSCREDRELIDSVTRYLREALGRSQEEGPPEESGEQLVAAIARFLDEHCGESIEMRELSLRFGISPSYLSTLFKKHKDLSPIEYLTQARIETAKRRLVRNPELLVKDVAETVGYPDHHYFSKVFRSATGWTPSEYRARHGSRL